MALSRYGQFIPVEILKPIHILFPSYSLSLTGASTLVYQKKCRIWMRKNTYIQRSPLSYYHRSKYFQICMCIYGYGMYTHKMAGVGEAADDGYRFNNSELINWRPDRTPPPSNMLILRHGPSYHMREGIIGPAT